MPPDAAAADTGSTDAPTMDLGVDAPDVPTLDAPPEDRGVVDASRAETGTDATVVDRPPLDAGQDGSTLDASADVGTDLGPDVPVDAGAIDAGTADAGVDSGPVDAGRDVPADVRVSCSVPAQPPRSCMTHDDCNVCIPGDFGERYCCAPLVGGRGECRLSLEPTCR
ncbi:MAG: hypothetical protein R3A52_15310 [Polyangiales bacterium]